MKIDNRTRWSTAQLRAVFARCAAEVRKTETGRWQLGKLIVTVKTQRANYGHAHYNSNRITMFMPETERGKHRRIISPAQIAEVFIHEIGHCLGHRHHRLDPETLKNSLHGSNYFTIEPSYFEWIKATFTQEAYPIETEAPPQKISPDEKIAAKLDRAVKNLKNAQRRLKLATTLFRKRKAKVGYYEKQLALAAAKKAESPKE